MNKAVFLDRDGTINEEMGYINHVSRFKMFEFVPKAVRLLNEAGFNVFIVTNQSGVARGYFDEALVQTIHQNLISELNKQSAYIDRIYYCPHHPKEGIDKYRRDCNCRKPKTGMIEQAKKDFDLDLENSYMIGDRYKDSEFAIKAGLHPLLVLTGYGIGEYTYQKQNWSQMPEQICDNLLGAAKWIVTQHNSEN